MRRKVKTCGIAVEKVIRLRIYVKTMFRHEMNHIVVERLHRFILASLSSHFSSSSLNLIPVDFLTDISLSKVIGSIIHDEVIWHTIFRQSISVG